MRAINEHGMDVYNFTVTVAEDLRKRLSLRVNELWVGSLLISFSFGLSFTPGAWAIARESTRPT
jgi:hypothetical protein